jgi:long-chain acyl-CoA synthetase
MQSEPIPDTIPSLLQVRADLTPHRKAYFSPISRRPWISRTWDEYRAEIERVAVGLQLQGLRAGDRLMILIPTGREWEIAHHAALMNGAVIVGMDPRASAQEIAWVMDHAQVNWVFSSTAGSSLIGEARLRNLKQLVVLDDQTTEAAAHVRWKDLLGAEQSEGSIVRQLVAQRRPEDVATIIYTSGTTGVPKGIAVTHRQLMVACRAIARIYPELEEGDTTICWLPLSALFQRVGNLMSMARGLTTYFLDDPRSIFESLGEIRPAMLIGVPRFYQKLLEVLRQTDPAASDPWRQSLKFMVSGSAPISSSILHELAGSGSTGSGSVRGFGEHRAHDREHVQPLSFRDGGQAAG